MAKKQFSEQPPSHAVSPKLLLWALVSLVVFFLLLNSVIRLGQKYFELRSRTRELQQQQTQLTQQEQNLSATNAYLATPEGVEQSLRERYDYIKPGEQMIVITPDQTPPPPPPSGVGHWWDELLEGLGLRKPPAD